jgi:serine/threonine-protein phosphatase 5
MSTYHVSLVLSIFEWVETNLICTTYVCLFHILIKVHNSFRSLEVEPHYAGPRIDGEEITIDFVKAMLDEFKKQKCIHKRYIIS